MIELEKLKAVQEIIVHDSCADGTASAMILSDVLPNAKVTFCQYESELHKTMEPKPGQLFCDFSPHRSRVQEFLDAGAIVLDHHGGPTATVTKAFVEKGLGEFADEKADPGVSGAVLAYSYVWLPLVQATWSARTNQLLAGESMPPPFDTGPVAEQVQVIKDLAVLAGIRDTWLKNDPRWREACEKAEAIRFWPWERIAKMGWSRWESELFGIGPVLFDRNLKHVDKCIEGAYKFVTRKGRKVTVFEGLKPTSDAAEVQGSSCDLTIGLAFFIEHGEQRLVFSTRSRGDFNCQSFALAHGGGGHTKAAGFAYVLTPKDPQPFELAHQVVSHYEEMEEEWLKVVSAPGFNESVKDGKVVPKELYRELWEHRARKDELDP